MSSGARGDGLRAQMKEDLVFSKGKDSLLEGKVEWSFAALGHGFDGGIASRDLMISGLSSEQSRNLGHQ